jgi:murein DD-endopeptidase MepM/ murein hydrolase activator NlpD
LLFTIGYFAVRYQQLSERYDQLEREQQTDLERGRGMRSTILTQQDDVKTLSDEVKQLESELEGIRKLSDQVRQLLGLPKGAQPPVVQPTPQSPAAPDGSGARVAGNAFFGGAPRPAMLLAEETTQEVEAMRPFIPWAEKELQYLANQSLVRLGRIEPSQRATQSELEAQLRLLAAAPTAWPVRGLITSDFGWRKALFNPAAREFHTGLDIAVWYFTPVKATKEGTVIYAGWQEGYGNVVMIAHEQGYVTVYGHNYDLKVRSGQQVKAGDVIARSGQTGYASGPHVHYEVRLYGKPIDPMRFLDLSP